LRVEGLEGWRVGGLERLKGLLHFGRRPASRQEGLERLKVKG